MISQSPIPAISCRNAADARGESDGAQIIVLAISLLSFSFSSFLFPEQIKDRLKPYAVIA